TSTITVIVTNQNAAAWTIASSAVQGSGFAISSTSTTTLNPQQQSLITVAFTPVSAGTTPGALVLQMVSGSGGAGTTLNVLLRGVAVQSQLVLSYILQPAGNQTPVADKDTIKFAATPVGTTATATIVVTNQGNGAGTFSAATISGAGFSIAGLPLLAANNVASSG